MKNDKIEVKHSPVVNGLGVFAQRFIKQGETVEVLPVILLPIKDFEHVQKTKLHFYFFEYSKTHFAIFLGYGSLYNHSFNPNARYLYNYKNQTIKVVALKDIKPGEEICFNYNYEPADQTPLGDWFKVGVAN